MPGSSVDFFIQGESERAMLTPAEHSRVLAALDLIQEAQNLLETAAQQLSPVNGFARQWDAVSQSRDRVKRTWHVVAARRQAAAQQSEPAR